MQCTVKPCFSKVRCINLIPGFRCDPCPPGFTGNMPEGIGVEYAVSNRQQCVDIDECSFNNGGCKGPCVNTPVTSIFYKFIRHFYLLRKLTNWIFYFFNRDHTIVKRVKLYADCKISLIIPSLELLRLQWPK